MNTANNTEDDNASVCANCGKEGSDVNNICNKCKQVKYCNAVCKKKHRHKHKKECDEHQRRAAERAAELHDIELFKQPPPQEEDCPICFILLPSLESGRRYKSCCGKVICCGCMNAPVYDNQGKVVDKKCPFCRIPFPASDEESRERLMERCEAGDAIAIHDAGCCYREGIRGFPQDMNKAVELFHRAGELGNAIAYNNIGSAYLYGVGVEVDEKKANHCYEQAAMRGYVKARHNLGIMEEITGNVDRALKHYMIAVRGGSNDSLKKIKQFYTDGFATKEDYTKALQSFQEYLGEIRSKPRDEAAAADESYRYY